MKRSNIKSLSPTHILYEDNHLLIVNKPAGVLVQGDRTGDMPLVDLAKNYIKKEYSKPGDVFLGVVHRLDRPTSGVIIFARTSKALSRLNDQFKQRSNKKIYWAIVEGAHAPKKAKLTHWLVRKPKINKSFAYKKEVPNSKEAHLEFHTVKTLDRYSCLAIDLHTGRHHQIRAQLNAIDLHIKGDLKYGASRSNPDGSIHLHAKSISFEHPVKKNWLTIAAPLPKLAPWSACDADASSPLYAE